MTGVNKNRMPDPHWIQFKGSATPEENMMKTIKNLMQVVILAVGIALAGGCGGGGGGGDNPPVVVDPGNPAIPASDATIVSTNALEISGTAILGGLYGGDPGVLGGAGLVGADPGAGAPLSKASVRVTSKAFGAEFAKPFGPETSRCALAGTVNVSGNLASDETLTAGDVFNMRFNKCDDGEGQVFDGAASMTVDFFDGDLFSGFLAFGITINFQNLAMTEGGETLTFNGDATVSVDTLAYPDVSAQTSGRSLSVAGAARTMALANYSTSSVTDASSVPAAYSIDASGRAGVAPHGWVNYTVAEPFAGFGEGNPTSGVMLITGGAGSKVTATAQADGQIRLDLDFDGNGVVDESRLVSWADLEG
jgi:hypothetical protein